MKRKEYTSPSLVEIVLKSPCSLMQGTTVPMSVHTDQAGNGVVLSRDMGDMDAEEE